MNAHDLMTPNPATVTRQSTVADALDIMRELDVRHVPVVHDGVLVGMLSDRDVAHIDVARLLSTEGADALRRELVAPVVTVMRSDVIFVEPDTDVNDVVELLIENKIGAIPVVRSDTREVVGIVSYIDALRALVDLLQPE
jgi:acetoin utilization protein AcuB